MSHDCTEPDRRTNSVYKEFAKYAIPRQSRTCNPGEVLLEVTDRKDLIH